MSSPPAQDLLTVVLRHIAKASRDLQLSEFRAILEGQAPTAEAVAMTIEEQVHAEEHAKGLAQGREALDLLTQAQVALAKAVPDSVELVQLRVTIAITRWRLDDDRPGTYAALVGERERIRQLNSEHPGLTAFDEFFSNYDAPMPG